MSKEEQKEDTTFLTADMGNQDEDTEKEKRKKGEEEEEVRRWDDAWKRRKCVMQLHHSHKHMCVREQHLSFILVPRY